MKEMIQLWICENEARLQILGVFVLFMIVLSFAISILKVL